MQLDTLLKVARLANIEATRGVLQDIDVVHHAIGDQSASDRNSRFPF